MIFYVTQCSVFPLQASRWSWYRIKTCHCLIFQYVTKFVSKLTVSCINEVFNVRSESHTKHTRFHMQWYLYELPKKPVPYGQWQIYWPTYWAQNTYSLSTSPHIVTWNLQFVLSYIPGADKSLARPGRKQVARVKIVMGRGMDWFG